MFKFVHCADLHLDSPLRGLSSLRDAPEEEIRLATRKALNNLVDLCIMEKVSFVVIAGDVYDGDWDDYSTGLFFTRMMTRLRASEIPVFLIRGNHDAASQISRSLVLPDNVHELATDRPETVVLEEINVAIHGQGFAQRAVTDNLAADYPPPEPGMFNIGVLHTCAEGQIGHEPYAPCRVDELAQKGYQYWALGHIHKRQLLHRDPPILFPGNIQGRHIREEGEKGCTLVSVDGATVNLEHRNLDVLRWYTCEVDLSGADSDGDVSIRVQNALGQLVDDNPNHRLAVRVICHGATSLHGVLLDNAHHYIHEVQNAALMVAGDNIWIEKVKFATEVPGFAATHGLSTGSQQALSKTLTNIVEDAGNDEEFIAQFLRDAQLIQGSLRDYLQMPDATSVDSEDDVKQILQEAAAVLTIALSKGGAK